MRNFSKRSVAACVFFIGLAVWGSQAHSFQKSNLNTSWGHWASSALPNGLRYRLVTPRVWHSQRKLVVAIHGCKMTAEDAATLTRLDEFAGRNGFAVLYPEQDSSSVSLLYLGIMASDPSGFIPRTNTWAVT